MARRASLIGDRIDSTNQTNDVDLYRFDLRVTRH
jgi:hypothetical protein